MRSLRVIAQEIEDDYASKGKPVHPYAKPYVDAMFFLNTMDDMYYADSADSIVRYALSNLSSWRGDTARRIKAELKGMLK
jgi:hypothetical protein